MDQLLQPTPAKAWQYGCAWLALNQVILWPRIAEAYRRATIEISRHTPKDLAGSLLLA
jgi:hypothetical protein